MARPPSSGLPSRAGKLSRLTMTSVMVELTEERRRNWRMLQYLSGLHIDRMEASHHEELEEWQQKYQQSSIARETSIDSIARGMAELAAASGAPAMPMDLTIPVARVRCTTGLQRQPARLTGRRAARWWKLPGKTCRSAPIARPVTRILASCSRRP